MKFLTSAAGAIALIVAAPASAATLVYDFGTSFGDVPASGPAPWLTATFDDGGSPGSVTLTMSALGSLQTSSISEVYFSFDSSIIDLAVSVIDDSAVGPTSIFIGQNSYQADGDGIYDLYFDLPPPPGSMADRFSANETIIYQITGTGLTAASFNYLSEPGGGNGPFYAAAHVQQTGDGSQSDWIGVVPIPAAVWLFGSGLGLLGWMRRKSSIAAK
jgi:hypothetical protein